MKKKSFAYEYNTRKMSGNNAGSCKNAMQDCRAFTNYQPICEVNNALQSKYAPQSSSEYRQFLQRNSCKIMAELRDQSGFVNASGCDCAPNHPPHDAASQARYQWQPSAEYLANRNKCFNQPILNRKGSWSNYC